VECADAINWSNVRLAVQGNEINETVPKITEILMSRGNEDVYADAVGDLYVTPKGIFDQVMKLFSERFAKAK
jgi:hypothetical protein